MIKSSFVDPKQNQGFLNDLLRLKPKLASTTLIARTSRLLKLETYFLFSSAIVAFLDLAECGTNTNPSPKPRTDSDMDHNKKNHDKKCNPSRTPDLATISLQGSGTEYTLIQQLTQEKNKQ
jgi:hypothetical protein